MFIIRSNVLSESRLERVADVLLTPLRYALGGKKFVCLPTRSLGFNITRAIPVEEAPASTWIATAAKCAVFILSPGLSFLGASLKFASLATCSHTRTIHWKYYWKEEETSISPATLKSPFTLAQACAPIAGEGALYQFESTLTQEQKFEIAKLLAHDWSKIRELSKFGLTEEQRFEVAKLCPDIYNLFGYLLEWDLTQDHLFEILQRCPKNYCNVLASVDLKSMRLTPKQYVEILKMLIPHQPCFISKIRHLLNQQEDLTALLLFAVTYTPSVLNLYSITPAEGYEDFRTYTVQYWQNRGEHHHTVMKKWIPDVVKKELDKIKNLEMRIKITDSIVSALYVWKNRLSDEEFSWVEKENLLFHLTALRTTDFTPFLLQTVPEIATNPDYRSQFEHLSLRLETKYPWVKLLKIPLLALNMKGIQIDSLIHALNSFKELSTPKIVALFRALTALAEEKALTTNEKNALVQVLAKGPLLRMAEEMMMIFAAGESASLKDLSPGISALAQAAFRKTLPTTLPLPEDFVAQYKTKIETYRIPNAVKIYAGRMQEAKEVLAPLGDHIVSVMDGSYLRRRYDVTHNPHLALFSKATLDAWQKNSQVPFEELLHENAPAQQQETMFQWLHLKLLVDQHLQLDNLPYVKQYLETGGEEGYSVLIERIKQDKTPVLGLQKKLIDLARSKEEVQSLRLLRELQSQDALKGTEFFRDIQGQIQKMGSVVESEKGWIACETDDPEDLFLCGTEIWRSCQHIQGTPSDNRGLIGYLRHGQTRLLAIKSKDGSLVARALLRLLWDGKKPVLFLERLYSNENNPDINHAIRALALRAAKRLRCPLTTLISDAEGAPTYTRSLQCLGGSAPYEYVDGAHMIKARGAFVLPAERLALLQE